MSVDEQDGEEIAKEAEKIAEQAKDMPIRQ
jgi:hypothetical protein